MRLVVTVTVIAVVLLSSRSATAPVQAITTEPMVQEQVTPVIIPVPKPDPVKPLADRFIAANSGVSEVLAYEAAIAVLQASNSVFTTDLIMSFLWEESNHRYDTESYAGALGLSQVMPSTCVWFMKQHMDSNCHVEKLIEPQYNVMVGMAFLKWLYGQYEGEENRMDKAFTAYNRGMGGVEIYKQRRGTVVSRYSDCIRSRVGLSQGDICQSLTKYEEGE